MFIKSKALYGLKQGLCAWYKWLINYLLSSNIKIENVDSTLFVKENVIC